MILGEAPSRTSDPARPFSGQSGRRLRLLVPDLDEAYELRNLLDEWPGRSKTGKGTSWKRDVARAAADRLAPELAGRLVVFAGRRVSAAFGHGRAPYLRFATDERGFDYVVLPHPSGVCRWWNDVEHVEAARLFLRALA